MLKTVTNSINASQIQTPITLPGDVTLSTGNLVIGTSGKGIDFSATPGTGTSELLADYEEGTWTPGQGGGVTVIGTYSSSGTYTKVGRLVTIRFTVAGSTTIAVNSGSVFITGLPFNGASADYLVGSAVNSSATLSTNPFIITNELYSAEAIPATAAIYGTITYMV
jgi:hypothetical protein